MKLKWIAERLQMIAIFLCVVLTVGCRASRSEGPVVTPIISSLWLSQEEVEQSTKKAQLGDRDAAFKLYQYYHSVKDDRGAALKWLVKAAENGHNVAQYTLGMVYSGELSPETRDVEKAKYWFRGAAENGHTEAKRKLKQLEVEPNH